MSSRCRIQDLFACPLALILLLTGCGRAGFRDETAQDSAADDSPSIITPDLPVAPTADSTVLISGHVIGEAVWVGFYSDPDCSNSIGSDSSHAYSSGGIVIVIPTNQSTPVYMQVEFEDGSQSPCTLAGVVVHDDQPPDVDVTSLSFSPASPSSERAPDVVGPADLDAAEVAFYGDAACTAVLGGGAVSNLPTGISISVTQDATTQVYARFSDSAGNQSSCELVGSYVHDGSPPALPTDLAFVPASPATEPQPAIQGTASADTADLFFFSDATCVTGIGSGDAAELGAGTITLTVATNTTTTVYMEVVDEVGNRTACAPVGDYTHVASLVVEPAFPTAGTDWNDYVVTDGGSVWIGTDSPCLGSEGRASDCAHAGELRRVSTPLSSCAAASAQDLLDVFEWVCEQTATATFFSTGFKPDKGLSDLIDAGGWRSNSVTVSFPGGSLSSTTAVWWNNPVVAAPANPGAADNPFLIDDVDDDGAGPDQVYAPGTIFFVAGNTTSSGYHLMLDGLGLVVLRGAELSYSGFATNHCHVNGGPGTDRRCLVSFDDKRYTWIEGALSGSGGGTDVDNVVVAKGSFARLHQLTVCDAVQEGIRLGGNAMELSHVLVRNNGGEGVCVCVYGSEGMLVRDSQAVGNSAGFEVLSADDFRGIRLSAAHNIGYGFVVNTGSSAFVDLVAYGHGVRGALFSAGAGPNEDTTAVGVINANNTGGLRVSSMRATVLGVTNVNNVESLRIEGDDATLVNVAHSNADDVDFSGNRPRVHNLVMEDGVLDLVGVNDGLFSGNLAVEAPDRCSVSGGTNPGLDDGTCAGSSAELRFPTDLSGSFVGKVATNDAANPDDFDGVDYGVNDFASVSDWLNFDNQWRAWGIDGGVFPAADQQGPCSAGMCRVWDWRLQGNDTELRYAAGTPATPTAPFVPGQDCPAAAHGDVAIVDGQAKTFSPGDVGVIPGTNTPCGTGDTCSNRFLLHARELVLDGHGDDDGLCERNEHCVYAPHVGAYVGAGQPSDTCTFQDGTVAGVTMYGYPNP